MKTRFFAWVAFIAATFQAQANDVQWSYDIATKVNTYFAKPYRHDPTDQIQRSIHNETYKVNRPNHALAHGMRQSLLARDIVRGLYYTSLKTPLFNSQDAINLTHWVANKIKTDSNFTKKIEFVAAFQRTGRGSEISGQSDPTLYQKYKQADAANFIHFAQYQVGPGKLFKDLSELQLYKETLYQEGRINNNQKTDYQFLSSIIKASHELDLRRMCSFNPTTIQNTVQSALFGSVGVGSAEQNFVSKLWARSGEYLNATGDQDVMMQKQYYSNRFFTQAHNPWALVSALHKVRQQSNIRF